MLVVRFTVVSLVLVLNTFSIKFQVKSMPFNLLNVNKRKRSHYLDDRAINERDHHDRRYVEEYRNDFCEVYDHRHYHRDYEKSHHHHYSKSSGRSRKSSHKRKHKRHHCSSHQSHSV
ncbi:dual specificity protein kinase clk4 isoform x1 [Limosa lapponica baueri]|uniref:Dual specificity protein kinase clk4 isoform x1 n=1 Tax=Limosa lapponica baueri TaxID=1758121 RepID=A0A2I0SZL5_LIMLA|nr:dual specificity protein kinase clk4 isoform x1 [Limosa lapponica baueri]